MTTKFSTTQIIKDHIGTFKLYNSGLKDRVSIFINFCVPFIVAIFFLLSHNFLTPKTINVLITAFSIFIALLLNLLFLIYSIMSRRLPVSNKDPSLEVKNEQSSEDKIRVELLHETYYNVQFSILVSIYSLIAIILYIFLPSEIYLDVVLEFIVYYFLFVFIMTLLMILKRTHTLFSREF